MFTLEQRLFMYDTYVKTDSCGKVRKKYIERFPGSKVPSRFTISLLVKKLRETGSLNSKIPRRKRTVLTEERVNSIRASLERSPYKPRSIVAQEVGASKSAIYLATKIFRRNPYRKSEDQELIPPHSVTEDPEIIPPRSVTEDQELIPPHRVFEEEELILPDRISEDQELLPPYAIKLEPLEEK